MTDNLDITKIDSVENGLGLTQKLKSELEVLINECFRERNMELVPDYFSLPMWHNFEYMLLLQDSQKDDRIVGGLIAFRIKMPHGVDFMLYDKIFVHPSYRGNGTYKDLISRARQLDFQVTKRHYPSGKQLIPAALRTSEEKLSRKYGELSDYNFERINNKGEKRIKYFVHLLGIRHHATKENIKQHYSKMQDIAVYVGSLLSTLPKIERDYILAK